MEQDTPRRLRVLEADDVDVVVPHVVPQSPDVAREQADVGAYSRVRDHFAARQMQLLVLLGGGLSMKKLSE